MVNKMKLAAAAAVCAAVVLGSGGAAFAGERTGNGKPTAGPVHARSSCVFSGLEDFDSEEPIALVDPGVVQNWGHSKDAPVIVAAPRGASDVWLDFSSFGGPPEVHEGCNANLYPNPEKQ